MACHASPGLWLTGLAVWRALHVKSLWRHTACFGVGGVWGHTEVKRDT